MLIETYLFLDHDMNFDHLLKKNNKREQRQNYIVWSSIIVLVSNTNAEFKQQ